MTLHVHLQNPPSKENLDYLRALLDENIKLTTGLDVRGSDQYHILVAGRPTSDLLNRSSILEVLIIPFAGIPRATQELLKQYPHLRVHNLHYNAASTAEFAFALLLAAAKNLLPMDRKLRQHDWTPRYEPNPSILLRGKRVLILGYGEIGRRVGQMCLGMGMQVHAIRRSIGEPKVEGEVEIYPLAELHSLLQKADVLMVCLPETNETRGMIGEEELLLLPDGAVVVNIARGEVIQEKALYEALAPRKLSAAGLDVWYRYPESEEDRSHTPPSNYPFHELENVVMSPHRAGGWTESGKHRMGHLAEILNKAARGEPMENLVDSERGY